MDTNCFTSFDESTTATCRETWKPNARSLRRFREVNGRKLHLTTNSFMVIMTIALLVCRHVPSFPLLLPGSSWSFPIFRLMVNVTWLPSRNCCKSRSNLGWMFDYGTLDFEQFIFVLRFTLKINGQKVLFKKRAVKCLVAHLINSTCQ